MGRGKKFERFDLKADDADFDALSKAAIGPSGNLRAPAVRVGKKWLVGFQPEAWSEVLGD